VAAILPLRLFLGATFLYAGLDKILDPRFFDPASPASINAQLIAFARLSPIGPLVRLAEPLAAPIGLLVAVAEIAVGLGALTGLAFRAAAVGGVLLSVLFWLTASWSTHPYYYGPDLPYAAGWLTLALAGHGNVLVPRRLSVPRQGGHEPATTALPAPPPPSPERRAVLQMGLLAAVAVAVASLAAPFRLLGGTARTPGGGMGGTSEAPGGSQNPPAQSPDPVGMSPSPSDAATAGAVVAKIADVTRRGFAPFTIPFDSAPPLPAGDPGIVVRLPNGTFVAFDATCTHAGCTVDWNAADGTLLCPCHFASFDPAHGAAVLDGPTNQPLTTIPIVVDDAAGTISLRA
jgi:thiosulfate dehydrogenase [quinone] large subunit